MAKDPIISTRSIFARLGFLRWFLYLGVILLLALGAAPTIISRTGLKDWIIAKATADLPLSVTVKELTLGWFSPIVADEIEVKDARGGPLARIPKIEVQRTLLQLAISRSDLGKIRVERPHVDVVFAGGTSNVETLLSEWPKSPPEPPLSKKPPAPKFNVQIADGTIDVRDDDNAKAWKLEGMGFALNHDATQNPPMSGTIKAAVTGEGDPGAIDAKIEGELAPTTKGTINATLSALPVSLAETFARRGGDDWKLAGRVKGDLASNWYLTPDGLPVFTLAGRLDGSNINVRGTPLGADNFAIHKADLPFQVSFNGSTLQIQRSELTWDLGKASAKATLDLGQPFLTSLSAPGTKVSATVDLAELARRLPNTLKLHGDVVLTAGQIALASESVASPSGGAVWEGKVATTKIVGTRGKTAISWQDPLTLSFKIRQTSRPLPDIEELTCKSSFLSANASATAEQVRVNAQVDLDKLAAVLGQFADMAAWGVAGRVNTDLVFRWPAGQNFSGKLDATFDQFQLGGWREPRLVVKLEGTGSSSKDLRIETGKAEISGSSDTAEATVREPIVIGDQVRAGFVYAKIDGDLGRWQKRFGPFVLLPAGTQLVGAVKGEVWVGLQTGKIDVKSVLVNAENFAFKTPTMNIADPKLTVQATAQFDTTSGTIDFTQSQIRGQSIVLHTPKLRVDTGKKSAAGSVIVSGQLTPIAGWFATPGVPAGPDVWSGAAFVTADFKTVDGGVDAEVSTKLQELAYGSPGKPKFRDPNASINAKIRYDGKLNSITFEKVQLDSQLGSIEAKGRFSRLDGPFDVDVQGTLAYDLAVFQPTFKSFLGAGAIVEGKDQRAFRVVGPLRPKGTEIQFGSLQGDAGLSWQRVSAYGADIGPADAKMKLAAGWLKVDPITSTINQGRLMLTPSLKLEPGPQEMILPAGPVIDGAKITPEMLTSALGYTLPMLANVAAAEGTFSVSLDGARLPLANPAMGDAQGTLHIHNAKVGSGPLITELTGLLKIGNPYSVIRDNPIRFKLEKGRVYHDNLILTFPDAVIVKTSGSVGVDGTLNMVAEFPLPQRLFGAVKLPAGVANTPVRLAIGGTVERPRIDSKALQDFVAQTLRNTAGNILDDQLKKLFNPR